MYPGLRRETIEQLACEAAIVALAVATVMRQKVGLFDTYYIALLG